MGRFRVVYRVDFDIGQVYSEIMVPGVIFFPKEKPHPVDLV